ncbi:hypothetical protein RHSIM_Rhsim04G0139000 [Rhododendron simsii]|uniref:NPH3 domain-containing protein n=1 Tax=Rhododendron simsii TaxID=118357 RepID=A0A834H054_RHOSS|nr:hypothetical protein RHSIM_Rhsim04G0139000 [Rhododendron simsii]
MDIPTDPETFELLVRFCQGLDLKIRILPSWNDLVKSLRASEKVLQETVKLGLVDACFESSIEMALVNPRLLGEPIRNPNNDNVDGNNSKEMKNGRNSWREVIEAVERLLPHEQGLLPCTLLFEMLNSAIIWEASSKCKQGLEIRIGKQLDQVTVKDLLIPSRRYAKEVGYDVECVASDVDLDIETLSLLIEMSISASIGTQRSFDGLYRAIDVYLDRHRFLTELERKDIFELERDFDKGREGCNDRLRKVAAREEEEEAVGVAGGCEDRDGENGKQESITTPFDHSPVVQEGHNVSGHGQKEASGGPNAEGVAEGNTVNPTEQIAPHVTQDLTLEQ